MFEERIDAWGNQIMVDDFLNKIEYYESFSANEISDKVGLSPKTAKKHADTSSEQRLDIEKTRSGRYQRNDCLKTCLIKKKAEKKCNEQDNEIACEIKEVAEMYERDLDCACEDFQAENYDGENLKVFEEENAGKTIRFDDGINTDEIRVN